jgi:hypothetical protein
MSKDAYWFHHDSNALQDPKVARLLRLHGLEGYGLFWAVIERLREAPDHLIECDSIPDICFQLRAKEEIFNSLFECQLLQKNDADSFFSESLIRRMERWNAKRETLRANGRKGGVAKAKQKGGKCLANAKQMPSKTLAIRSEKIREDEIREDEIKTVLPAEADASPVPTVTVSDNDEAQSGLHSKPQTGNHTTHRRLFAFADCEAQLLQAGATPSIIDAMRKHYADRLEQLSQRAAIGIMEGLSSEAFSGVNVPLEIAKAAAWEKMNPSKRKTHAGIGKFLSGWMTRVQNSGGSQPSWNQSQSQQPEAPKPPVKMLDTDDYRTRPRPAYFESEAERAMKEHQKKLEQGQQ